MTKKPPTKAGSIRLPLDSWAQFRVVLNTKGKGRVWLMRLIEREHKKIVAKSAT